MKGVAGHPLESYECFCLLVPYLHLLVHNFVQRDNRNLQHWIRVCSRAGLEGAEPIDKVVYGRCVVLGKGWSRANWCSLQKVAVVPRQVVSGA
jgi:hypothetical protein